VIEVQGKEYCIVEAFRLNLLDETKAKLQLKYKLEDTIRKGGGEAAGALHISNEGIAFILTFYASDKALVSTAKAKMKKLKASIQAKTASHSTHAEGLGAIQSSSGGYFSKKGRKSGLDRLRIGGDSKSITCSYLATCDPEDKDRLRDQMVALQTLVSKAEGCQQTILYACQSSTKGAGSMVIRVQTHTGVAEVDILGRFIPAMEQ